MPLPSHPVVHGYGFGALFTTGLVASIGGFCASLLYFHFFPQVEEKPVPIAVVDMVKLGMAVTQMSSNGDQAAFMNAGRAVAMLKEYGYIVLDSRMVITAPDQYVKKPSDIIIGAPDIGGDGISYVPPALIDENNEKEERNGGSGH